MTESDTNLLVLDAHIHLYAASHLHTLNWTSALPTNHILNQQRGVQDFRSAIRHNPSVLGFIFVETDRRSTSHSSGWVEPLEEIAFLARIVQGQPRDGEGHTSTDKTMVLGIVPWAPVVAGPAALKQYVSQAKRICSGDQAFALIKGFRYLVQDKPPSTMLQTEFLEALIWLGNNGFCFDLGVDARSGGMWQLQEACEMLRFLSKSENPPIIIVNHCCKPNLQITVGDEGIGKCQEFVEWASYIREMGSFPNTFMKLSGFFSELPTQHEHAATPIPALIEKVMPWVNVVFETFTPSRVMFGSDWPVCTANGPGEQSWQHWHDLVMGILETRKLTNEEKANVLSGTAMRAYNIKSPRH